ncbi:MAG: single-stranded DNA-binding protein [Clostridia bacterium]
MENYNESNVVEIGGKIVSEPEFSHELFDEKFYKIYIETKRLSGYYDKLPVIISERLLDIDELKQKEFLHIEGQLRSYNQQIDGRSKLVLSIFCKDVKKVEDETVDILNECDFIGYICKQPIYRKTPLGREIADVLIAVNRTYKKSDYIPCILWGRNAKFCEKLNVGTMVKINGRLQSRNYEKKLPDGTVLPKVAYEVSVSKFSVNNQEDKKQEEKQVE